MDAFVAAGGDPVRQAGDLVAEFLAGAGSRLRQRFVAAAFFQMDRQDAQVGGAQVQRDVGAAAQAVAPSAVTSGLIS